MGYLLALGLLSSGGVRALTTSSSGLGSLSASGTFTDGSLGVRDWTVSTQDLIASTTVSWLLRTVFRISSCTSCGLFGMICSPSRFDVANFTKQRIGMSSDVLGIGSGARGGTRWDMQPEVHFASSLC